MKLRLALAVLTLATCQSADVCASIRYELGGGLSVPIWPKVLRRGWSAGPNIAVGVSFDAGDELEGALTLDYSMLALDSDDDCRTGVFEGGGVKLFSITANVRTFVRGLQGTAKPYLTAGGGYHNFHFSELRNVCPEGSTIWETSSDRGVAVVMYGAGIKFPISRGIESLLQGHLMESWSPEHGSTSRSLVIRMVFRPKSGWL